MWKVGHCHPHPHMKSVKKGFGWEDCLTMCQFSWLLKPLKPYHAVRLRIFGKDRFLPQQSVSPGHMNIMNQQKTCVRLLRASYFGVTGWSLSGLTWGWCLVKKCGKSSDSPVDEYPNIYGYCLEALESSLGTSDTLWVLSPNVQYYVSFTGDQTWSVFVQGHFDQARSGLILKQLKAIQCNWLFSSILTGHFTG